MSNILYIQMFATVYNPKVGESPQEIQSDLPGAFETLIGGRYDHVRVNSRGFGATSGGRVMEVTRLKISLKHFEGT